MHVEGTSERPNDPEAVTDRRGFLRGLGKVAAVTAVLGAETLPARAAEAVPVSAAPIAEGIPSGPSAIRKGSVMLDKMTLDTFAPHLDTPFRLLSEGKEPVELKLIRAEQMTSGKKAPNPFSFHLLFLGPTTPRLEQRTYHLEHEEIGSFDLFLVPVGEDGKGRQYEAVFNRRI